MKCVSSSEWMAMVGDNAAVQTTTKCWKLALENCRHLAMLPLVSPSNDVGETSAEIPYWWRGMVEINLRCGTTNQIRSITQIWVVTHRQYGISALVSQTSFGKETSGSVAKCRLFSQANTVIIRRWKNPISSSWIKHVSAVCTCHRWQSFAWKPMMHFDATTLDDVKADTNQTR